MAGGETGLTADEEETMVGIPEFVVVLLLKDEVGLRFKDRGRIIIFAIFYWCLKKIFKIKVKSERIKKEYNKKRKVESKS